MKFDKRIIPDLILGLASSCAIVGALFKIQHWAGGSGIVFTGILFLILGLGLKLNSYRR
jgi:hypothetical protein